MRFSLPGRGRYRNVVMVERAVYWSWRPRWWNHRDYIVLWIGPVEVSVSWEES